jgi:hypothetical protein
MSIGKRYKFQGTKFGVETSRATSKLITAITIANPGVFTAATHGYAVGDTVYIDADAGMPDLTAGEYVVASVPSANTFTLAGVNTTGYSAFAVDSPNSNVSQKIIFSDFCELTGYNQQDGTSDEIDATTVCSTAKEFEVGLPDSGTLSLDYNAAPNSPVQAAMRAARAAGQTIAFSLIFPNGGGTVLMFGSVQSTTLSGSNGDLHKASASVRLTGDIVVLV